MEFKDLSKIERISTMMMEIFQKSSRGYDNESSLQNLGDLSL